MEITSTLMMSTACGAGGALFVKHIWDRWQAPDKVARRAEDRFVLKETCEKCDQGHSREARSLRHDVQEVKVATTENGKTLLKIAAHLNVE